MELGRRGKKVELGTKDLGEFWKSDQLLGLIFEMMVSYVMVNI